MPKSQHTTKIIRQARLAPSESPDATNNNVNVVRKQAPWYLPKPASDLREALYDKGRLPSNDEKELVYQQIVAIPEVGRKYTRKAHSNFCTRRQRERATELTWRCVIAAKMKETPNPTLLDFMVWKKEIGASLWEVVRIAEAEVSDVIKQRANGECLMDSFIFFDPRGH